jgi:hypothetical protein
MTSSWSRESHLIQVGRVAMGRSSARATAPSGRSMQTSGHFEPRIDRFPWRRRHPKRQPTTGRHSTAVDDLTRRSRVTRGFAFDQRFYGPIVRPTTTLSNNQGTLVNLRYISTAADSGLSHRNSHHHPPCAGWGGGVRRRAHCRLAAGVLSDAYGHAAYAAPSAPPASRCRLDA